MQQYTIKRGMYKPNRFNARSTLHRNKQNWTKQNQT